MRLGSPRRVLGRWWRLRRARLPRCGDSSCVGTASTNPGVRCASHLPGPTIGDATSRASAAASTRVFAAPSGGAAAHHCPHCGCRPRWDRSRCCCGWGAFSSASHNAAIVTVHQAVKASKAPTVMTPAEEHQKRGAVVGVLNEYQRDYSSHSTSGLSGIFAENIKRHGLSGSGCSVVEGRQPVLEDYEQQFEAGTGAYTLVGLSPGQVRLSGPNDAEVHSHYEISSGGSGFINFKLAANSAEWKISEVYATCA